MGKMNSRGEESKAKIHGYRLRRLLGGFSDSVSTVLALVPVKAKARGGEGSEYLGVNSITTTLLDTVGTFFGQI